MFNVFYFSINAQLCNPGEDTAFRQILQCLSSSQKAPPPSSCYVILLLNVPQLQKAPSHRQLLKEQIRTNPPLIVFLNCCDCVGFLGRVIIMFAARHPGTFIITSDRWIHPLGSKRLCPEQGICGWPYDSALDLL